MKFKLLCVHDLLYEGEEDKKARYTKLGFKYDLYKPRGRFDEAVKWQKVPQVEPLFIEIDSLQDLLDLNREYGQIIIDQDYIIIYDDYME
jgi:hypothetical protein